MAGIKYDLTLGIQQALQSLDKFTEKIRKVSSDLDEMSSKINGFATAGTAALIGLGASAAAFADELADVAAANETTINSVLGLGAALQGAGGNADSVGRLLQSLSNNMESANSGNLKMVSTFEKLGVSISDLGSLSQDQIRNNVIKNLAEMKDVTERNALAQQMFGKAALGVNWKAVAADIDENTRKYEQYNDSLKTAGDAFDAMGSIIKDIKIAAAEAFEPLFKYIAKLKIDIPTVTTLIKVFAAALAVAVSASVLAGFAKLLVLLKDIGMVVSKNKLVTIIGTLLSIGVGVATWTGLMKDTEEAINDTATAQENVNEKTEKTKRDQTGIYEAIKKQKDSLTQVTEQYNRQIKNIQDKLKFESESLLLTEEEKRIKQEQNAIETQTENSLASLKQKYDAMDIDARKRVQAEYEKEKKAIESTGQAAKKDVEERILGIIRLQNQFKEFQNFIKEVNDVNIKRFELLSKQISDNSGYQEKIDLEQKLIALGKIRTTIGEGLVGLSQKEKEEALAAVTIATTATQNLGLSYDQINKSIEENIKAQIRAGIISQKVGDAIINSNRDSRISILQNAETIANTSKEIADQSRTFSYGWSKAFRDYTDEASNAARAAERIFQKVTSGMEDMIVNFAKTGKFEFKSFMNSILEELLRSQVRQLMSQVFNVGGATSTGSSGNIFKSIGKLLGFANGGVIPTDGPVIVGERGPELISGAAGRVVTPNNQLGTSTNVVYNISAVDALSFKQMLAQDPSFIYAVTEQGRRTLPTSRR